MYKKVLGLGLVLILFAVAVFAEEESMTITTYYPSPYGSYNQLEVYRSVTYKPLASTPTTEPREGELVYVDSDPSDSTPGQFYYYGGGTWVAQGGGGGGGNYFLACSCPSGTTDMGIVDSGVALQGAMSDMRVTAGTSSTRKSGGSGITLSDGKYVACCYFYNQAPPFPRCVHLCK